MQMLWRRVSDISSPAVHRADPPVSTGFAVGFQLIIWFVKLFTANACAIAIIGFAYGPVFPGNMGQAHEYLPAEVRMVAMAIMWVCRMLVLVSVLIYRPFFQRRVWQFRCW